VHGKDAKDLREQIAFGASPRCEIATLHAAAAYAFLNGDDHIEPSHVKRVFPHIARHRIILTDAAIHDGVTTDKVVKKVLERVKVVDTSASK
jgi:MoxR-like ATPase